jgi:hypothetical protein
MLGGGGEPVSLPGSTCQLAGAADGLNDGIVDLVKVTFVTFVVGSTQKVREF